MKIYTFCKYLLVIIPLLLQTLSLYTNNIHSIFSQLPILMFRNLSCFDNGSLLVWFIFYWNISQMHVNMLLNLIFSFIHQTSWSPNFRRIIWLTATLPFRLSFFLHTILYLSQILLCVITICFMSVNGSPPTIFPHITVSKRNLPIQSLLLLTSEPSSPYPFTLHMFRFYFSKWTSAIIS